MLYTALVALAVLAVAGLLHIVRGTPVERVLAPGDPDGPPSVADDGRFVRAVELLTGARLERGHRVEVLENGDGTYERLWRDLEAAQLSVTVQMYYAKPGRVADAMAERLAERARAGVPVLLLLDAFGTLSVGRKWRRALREAGVQVAVLRPASFGSLHKLGNRSHVRAIVVDGRAGYTGGFGLADYWLGDGRHPGQWRETNVRFEGPVVQQLQAAFVTAWAEATGTLLTGATFFPAPTPDPNVDGGAPGDEVHDDVRASLLYTTPAAGSTSAERFLALSVTGARERLYVTNSYFTPDDDLRRHLLDAAARGVDVRVVTAGPESDVKTTFYAGRSRYGELLAGGVRIYEYRTTMMHAKTLVVDGCWCVLGTMNFDNRSLAHNDEAALVAWDSALGAELEAMFERDLAYCDEITLDAWRRRGLGSRMLEPVARLMARLL
jgi:cardiolipin synthase